EEVGRVPHVGLEAEHATSHVAGGDAEGRVTVVGRAHGVEADPRRYVAVRSRVSGRTDHHRGSGEQTHLRDLPHGLAPSARIDPECALLDRGGSRFGYGGLMRVHPGLLLPVVAAAWALTAALGAMSADQPPIHGLTGTIALPDNVDRLYTGLN